MPALTVKDLIAHLQSISAQDAEVFVVCETSGMPYIHPVYLPVDICPLENGAVAVISTLSMYEERLDYNEDKGVYERATDI